MFADTDSIRDLAAALRARADEIRAEADRLVARADATAWEGLAADAMRWHTRTRAAALRRTGDLHDEAADALERHARAVDAVTDLAGDAADGLVDGLVDGVRGLVR